MKSDGGEEQLNKEALTHSQKRALLHIMRGKNVFVTGGSGTGKSAVIKLAVSMLEEQGKSVVVTAPTGIAALRVGGSTIHSVFGFPAECSINDGGAFNGCSLRVRTSSVIRGADVLVIDEISMVRMDLFDSVIASLQKIEEETGKHIQLIVSGDFYQLPPVLKQNSIDVQLMERFYARQVTPDTVYAFQSAYWKKCHFYTVVLQDVIRQTDPEFAEVLNQLRTGDSSRVSYFNERCLTPPPENAVRLFAKNSDVLNENRSQLNRIPGQSSFFRTTVTYAGSDRPSGLAIPEDLELKNGAHIIMTANWHGPDDAEDIEALTHNGVVASSNRKPLYVNGSVGHVTLIDSTSDAPARDVIVTIDGRDLLLHPTTYNYYKYAVDKETGVTTKVLVAMAYQLPLRLAYGITIHRSQGMTYDEAVINPRSFASGQLYVALSRVRTIEGLHLLQPIREKDVKVSKSVSEFYDRLTGKTTKRTGRPPKNQNGTTRDVLIWVPTPLEKHVREEVEKGHTIKMSRLPKYAADRIHMRVPSNLAPAIKNEIAVWKEKSRSSDRPQ